MAPMNLQQAAVVEPILSTHARGYRNAQFIYPMLAPIVDIPSRSTRIIKFGKEDFRKVNTRRAPGAATGRIQYGYASDPVSLPQDSLEAVVPTETQEEAAAVPGFDLAKISVDRVLNVFGLNMEIHLPAGADRADFARLLEEHKTQISEMMESAAKRRSDLRFE